MDSYAAVMAAVALLMFVPAAQAAGHGPVFGAATPVLGRGGWSLDEAWTTRAGEGFGQDMLRTMISYGVTENLQLSGSFPATFGPNELPESRMMAAMSSRQEFEGLVAYRFDRHATGVGSRRESTLYVGGTGSGDGSSVELGGATGYASRAQYVWIGGNLQHFTESLRKDIGDSVLLTFVYGYRPPALRTEAGRPDLRFFVESTAEDRSNGTRTVFVGPTALLLHRAFGVEGGVLFPAYQRSDALNTRERYRVAVDISYFFWLK